MRSDVREYRKNQLLREIDNITGSDQMSQEEALEFLEEMQSDLEGRIDGIKEDLEE